MHLFMNNQIIYSEANSIKIYHKTFMSKVLEVCNWIVSNLFSRIAKIFRLPVLIQIFDKWEFFLAINHFTSLNY